MWLLRYEWARSGMPKTLQVGGKAGVTLPTSRDSGHATRATSPTIADLGLVPPISRPGPRRTNEPHRAGLEAQSSSHSLVDSNTVQKPLRYQTFGAQHVKNIFVDGSLQPLPLEKSQGNSIRALENQSSSPSAVVDLNQPQSQSSVEGLHRSPFVTMEYQQPRQRKISLDGRPHS